MPRLFISYRRTDSEIITGRIYDRLIAQFGTDAVFMDIDDIAPGQDFRTVIRTALDTADILLVVIGPDWLDARDATGQRRLDTEDDWVRTEVTLGLQAAHVTVIPLLVKDAAMPPATELPPPLHDLAYLNAVEVHRGQHFSRDIDRLIRAIERARQPQATPNTAHPSQTSLAPTTALSRTATSFPLTWAAAAGGVIILAVLGVVLSGVLAGGDGGDEDGVDPASIRAERNSEWEPEFRNFGPFQMALVPAGCFRMGSTDGNDNESPAHEQCIDEAFWIDVYEVTNQLYGSTGEGEWCERVSAAPSEPRVCVGLSEASEFCKSRGGRLPTELEWEYAARGPSSWRYPWGDTYIAANVIGADSTAGTSEAFPVGTRPTGASWVGAQDMAGNVYEWTRSIYGTVDGARTFALSYPYDPNDGREDNTRSFVAYTMRGGAYFEDEFRLRSAYRTGVFMHDTEYYLGFRCVRDY